MEQQGEYITEVQEAVEMLGKGYDQEMPYEIHMPARIIGDGEGGQQEFLTGVWIKITASFRDKHLKKLKGSRLGVWLCIALHINERNDSHPSIETICKETGYSNREVIDCIRELEADGYLTVIRGKERYNIYHVNFGAAYGKGNTPTSEESSHVKLSAGNSELYNVPPMLKSSLKEEPIKKNQKERTPLDFKNMTVGQARKVPTLKLYTEATDYFPGSVLWETVHKAITENSLTFEKLHSAAVEWAMRGYKPENVKGILEWAVNGIPGGSKFAPEAKPQINEHAVEQTRELVEQKTSGTFVPRPATVMPPAIVQTAVRDLSQRKGIRR